MSNNTENSTFSLEEILKHIEIIANNLKAENEEIQTSITNLNQKIDGQRQILDVQEQIINEHRKFLEEKEKEIDGIGKRLQDI